MKLALKYTFLADILFLGGGGVILEIHFFLEAQFYSWVYHTVVLHSGKYAIIQIHKTLQLLQ
jgi:hypothetical protein